MVVPSIVAVLYTANIKDKKLFFPSIVAVSNSF